MTQLPTNTPQFEGFPAPLPLSSPSPTERAPRTPVWLWVLVLALLAGVVYLQQPGAPDQTEIREAHAGLKVVPLKTSEFVLMVKLGLALKQATAMQPNGGGGGGGVGDTPGPSAAVVQIADQQVGNPSTAVGFGVAPDKDMLARIRDKASAEDRLRVAILAGELEGPPAARARLEGIEDALDDASVLRADLDLLRAIYADGAVARDVALASPPDAIAGLRERHGLLAELALTTGEPDAPARTAAAGSGFLLLAFFGFVLLGLGLALFVGVVLLIFAATMVFSPRFAMAFQRPVPAQEFRTRSALAQGRWTSVWLETVAVFIASFLLLKFVTEGVSLLATPKSPGIVWVTLLGQWALIATIFWPIARGMTFARWKEEIGWRAPRGLFREIGFGFCAYLAALPIYFTMALVVVVFILIGQHFFGGDPPSQSNKIIDIVSGGSIPILLMLFALATVWAPIVEESIFRGALFRHLRRRLAFPLAALLSAGAFAVMHGYVIYGLVMVGTLGALFAVMREWRGSIIPSATAHFIHNSVVLSIILVVVLFSQG